MHDIKINSFLIFFIKLTSRKAFLVREKNISKLHDVSDSWSKYVSKKEGKCHIYLLVCNKKICFTLTEKKLEDCEAQFESW